MALERAPTDVDDRTGTLDRMGTLQDTRPPFPRVEEAALLRIPTSRSWEIPAYMLFGGGIAGPHPEQIVAVARHWHERYGADICAMGKPVNLEFRIARPPGDQPEALALMRWDT